MKKFSQFLCFFICPHSILLEDIFLLCSAFTDLYNKKCQDKLCGKNIVALKNEQGPGIGAAMIAAMGCRWFKDWNSCINVFVKYNEIIAPDPHNTALYQKYYHLYHKIYNSIAPLARAATRL